MFRFSIRDVLWLTVVVALGLGWVLERQRSTGLQQHVDIARNEAELSRAAMKSLYDDLSRIEQALAPHGLAFAWSKDLRPSIQRTPRAAGGPATLSRP